MTTFEIMKLFATKEFKGEVVGSILDLPDCYVVAMTRPNLKSGDAVLDNEWQLDKKTKKIKVFNHHMVDANLRKQYLEALKKPIMYIRPGLIDR